MKKITIIVIGQHIEYHEDLKCTKINDPKIIETKTINILPNEEVNIKLNLKN